MPWGCCLFGRRRTVVWNQISNPLGSDCSDSLYSLYTAEREAGTSVLTNTLGVWFATTTYITFAFSALHIIKGEIPKGELVPALILFALPYPAIAFAGYHMILFSIGVVRSRSIGILEEQIMQDSTHVIVDAWMEKPPRIGSKAETAWTDLGQAKWSMRITAAVSYPAPYILAGVLAYSCLGQVEDGVLFENWIYTAVVTTYIVAGLAIGWLGVRTLMPLVKGP